MRLLSLVALVAAFVGAEWVGWWAVPATAALWGLLAPRIPRPALVAGLAAGSAAALWLLLTALGHGDGFGRLLEAVSGIFHLPAPVLILLTLVFPGLLAWSAAALAGARRSTATTTV